LQRQVIHSHSSLGISKAESAANAIKELNDGCKVRVYKHALDPSNALEIISTFDLVLDASDNPGTRYLINDSCVMTNTPLVSASALRMEGQLTTYVYNGGPCYRWYAII
jgi:adenylyltransferase/sulfurtransferase